MWAKLGRGGDLVGINCVDKMWIAFKDWNGKDLGGNDKKSDKIEGS